MRLKRLAVLVAAFALVASACGDDDGGVSIDQPWARASAMMQDAGAAYMQLTSSDGDTLLSASVDASVAGVVELHEVVMVDMSDDDDMADMSEGDDMEGMGGAMQMQQVMSIDLPAGETVALEPGGYHVMMMDLVDPLEEGDTFMVTLEFQDAGDIEVEVEVREEAP